MNENVKISAAAAAPAVTAASVTPPASAPAPAAAKPTAKPTARLAIHGGERLRKTPMPARIALGDDELGMVHQVIDFYRERQVDPGYQGTFEKLYTDEFVSMMGGGYADAVAT